MLHPVHGSRLFIRPQGRERWDWLSEVPAECAAWGQDGGTRAETTPRTWTLMSAHQPQRDGA